MPLASQSCPGPPGIEKGPGGNGLQDSPLSHRPESTPPTEGLGPPDAGVTAAGTPQGGCHRPKSPVSPHPAWAAKPRAQLAADPRIIPSCILPAGALALLPRDRKSPSLPALDPGLLDPGLRRSPRLGGLCERCSHNRTTQSSRPCGTGIATPVSLPLPFLSEPLNLRQLSRETKMSLSCISYHLSRLFQFVLARAYFT